MKELFDTLIENITPILITFVTGLITYLGTRLKTIYEQKVRNQIINEVVNSTVNFVEQVYKDSSGPEKLDMAISYVTEILESKGIKITGAEIRMLIESAVYNMNQTEKPIAELNANIIKQVKETIESSLTTENVEEIKAKVKTAKSSKKKLEE